MRFNVLPTTDNLFTIVGTEELETTAYTIEKNTNIAGHFMISVDKHKFDIRIVDSLGEMDTLYGRRTLSKSNSDDMLYFGDENNSRAFTVETILFKHAQYIHNEIARIIHTKGQNTATFNYTKQTLAFIYFYAYICGIDVKDVEPII